MKIIKVTYSDNSVKLFNREEWKLFSPGIKKLEITYQLTTSYKLYLLARKTPAKYLIDLVNRIRKAKEVKRAKEVYEVLNRKATYFIEKQHMKKARKELDNINREIKELIGTEDFYNN